MRQSTARAFQPTPCADPGCGSLALPGCVYCGKCGGSEGSLSADDEDLDVHVLTLRERLAEGGPLLRRIARYGTSPCVLCARPSLPGRQYCSNDCRREARARGSVSIMLDGITASMLEHARRIGMNRSTVYRRLQLGMTPVEALTRPIDTSMRRSAA